MNKYEDSIINTINWNKQYRNYSLISNRIDYFFFIIKIINIKIIILYFAGFFIYLYSLTPIKDVGMKCFKFRGVNCYYSLAILIFISSILISISIFLIINLKYSKIHLLIICIIYIVIFLIDHNDGIKRHGIFNFLLLLNPVTRK